MVCYYHSDEWFPVLSFFPVMWNDIDLYRERVLHSVPQHLRHKRVDALRDFTSDPVTFSASEMRAFIEELVC